MCSVAVVSLSLQPRLPKLREVAARFSHSLPLENYNNALPMLPPERPSTEQPLGTN